MPKHTELKPAPKTNWSFRTPVCRALVWSDEVPTIPGWYWRRDGDGRDRITRLPYCGVWPTPWKKIKALTIAEAGKDVKDEIMAIPDGRWRIEWAGPIPSPKKP